MKKTVAFLTKDIVFLIAMIFAIFSCLLVRPSLHFFSYINTNVLIIMFSLMIAVGGMKKANLFSKIAIYLTSKFYTIRYIALTLVLSSFFLGMWVTNDAVLLTLVPFTIIVTKQTGQEKYTLLIVIFQTFAANMGATLTPMGDPQNIYLYSFYHLEFGDFILHMLPITLTAAFLLVVSVILMIPNDFVHPIMVSPDLNKKDLPLHFVIFFVTLLTVLGWIPAYITFAITGILTIIFFPRLLREVDYHLLLTFMMFFIFKGNITTSGIIDHLFSSLLSTKIGVYFVALFTSQLISNVPASVLLSPFVDPLYAYPLIQGANVGAMGSIVGSLASLITFKFVIKSFPNDKKNYLKTYTFLSIIYIIIITCIVFLTY